MAIRKSCFGKWVDNHVENSFAAKAVIVLLGLAILAGVITHDFRKTRVFYQSVSTGMIISVEENGKLVPFRPEMENDPYQVIPVK